MQILASGSSGVAFMSPDHPSEPPGPERFSGKGMFLTLQVADATAAFKRLKQAGVAIAYPLRDEAWGRRRFGLLDPAGIWVQPPASLFRISRRGLRHAARCGAILVAGQGGIQFPNEGQPTWTLPPVVSSGS